MTTHLGLAVETADSWVPLTPATETEVERLRAPTLRDAAHHTARSDRQVYIDVDVFLSDSVGAAFCGLARVRPGWAPGRADESLVHAGTPATLAGLLWDIGAARVADGVTLRSAAPGVAVERILAEVLPLLASRGIAVGVTAVA
ncbi:MAG: hypothetical protein QM728_06735 [Gordonia sp. (in: high G+C Gram-positive bacteria)]|uniref:hypothetical protein n=1 Tax=Gordonia sp. (in: high G+C Gram-positive bacteria) TaxID=84139 RepID=UPI0039E3A64B